MRETTRGNKQKGETTRGTERAKEEKPKGINTTGRKRKRKRPKGVDTPQGKTQQQKRETTMGKRREKQQSGKQQKKKRKPKQETHFESLRP